MIRLGWGRRKEEELKKIVIIICMKANGEIM